MCAVGQPVLSFRVAVVARQFQIGQAYLRDAGAGSARAEQGYFKQLSIQRVAACAAAETKDFDRHMGHSVSEYSTMDVVMVNPIASEHRNLWREADKVLTFAH
jgi:hypothetical protein